MDAILPDLDAQLCRRDRQLVLLVGSFVFDALLAELLERVEKNYFRNRSAARKPQHLNWSGLVVTSFEAGAAPGPRRDHLAQASALIIYQVGMV